MIKSYKNLKTLITTMLIIVGMGFTGTAAEYIVNDNPNYEDDGIDWLAINVESAGSLGVEILYNVDVLSDVTALRVSGPLNDADWTTIKNLGNLQHLDLENAITYQIPNQQFYNKSKLESIKFPKILSSIGESAFYRTGLKTLYFPESLTTINQSAFSECKSLEKVEFDENCKIQTIPSSCFSQCSNLTDVVLSNSVKNLNSECFYYCTNLKNINIPKELSSIGNYTFYYASSLENVIFPETLRSVGSYAFRYSAIKEAILPLNLTSLGGSAFSNCNNLEIVQLPNSIVSYNDQINSVSNLKRVICTTATPPSVTNLFSNANLSGCTLEVPEFALVSYKLDSFWMRFGNIQGTVKADSWIINRDLTLSNNRRMDGTPSLTITNTGTLTIGGTAPMPLNNFDISLYKAYRGENNSHGQFINNSLQMTANNAEMKVTFYGNYWHFISLPFDVKRSDIRLSDSNAQFVVRYYNGEGRSAGNSSNWVDVAEDGVLEAGKGYILQTNKECTLTFPALGDDAKAQMFKYSDFTMPLEENPSENVANAGWNLIGNPYFSCYDLYYTYQAIPVTLWDVYNRNYKAYSLLDDNVLISPLEAFFIQTPADSKEFVFNKAGRQFSLYANPRSVRHAAPANGSRELINLKLTSAAGLSSEARVVINESASEDYEPACDASKFFSPDEVAPELYSLDNESNPLAINERPTADGIVRLGFYAPMDGRYILTISSPKKSVFLQDAENESCVDITDGYEFDAAAGYNDVRFALKLNSGCITAVEDVNISNVNIYTESGCVVIEGGAGAIAEVYALDGGIVAQQALSEKGVISLAKGVYIVKIGGKIVKCLVK